MHNQIVHYCENGTVCFVYCTLYSIKCVVCSLHYIVLTNHFPATVKGSGKVKVKENLTGKVNVKMKGNGKGKEIYIFFFLSKIILKIPHTGDKESLDRCG